MRKLFERTVRTAVAMKLVDLAVQAVDGTKVVANASLNRSYDAEGLRGLLDRVERAIEDLDQNEAGEDTAAAHLPEELADKEVLREKVKQAMDDLANQERHRINLTDREARLIRAGHCGWLQRPGYGLTRGDGWGSDRHVGHRGGRGGQPMTMPCWRR